MIVDVVGYNRFDYTNRDGESKTAVKFFCKERNHSDKITFGCRVFEVFSSPSYASKITDGINSGKDIHIGWKDNRSFLYLAKDA